jgi:hypothetical protein
LKNNNEYWPWESRPVGDLLDGGSLVAEFCEDFLCRCEDAAHVSRTDLRLRGTVTLRERGLAVHYDLLEKSLARFLKPEPSRTAKPPTRGTMKVKAGLIQMSLKGDTLMSPEEITCLEPSDFNRQSTC